MFTSEEQMHLFIFLKFSLSYSGLNENIIDIATYFFSSSFAGDGKRELGKFKNKILVFECVWPFYEIGA